MLVILASCGSAERSADVRPLGGDLALMWSAEATLAPRLRTQPPPLLLPAAFPWGDMLYAKGGEIVCADDLTGRVRWTAEADTGSAIQAAACREEVAVLEPGTGLRTFSRDGRQLGAWATAELDSALLATPGRIYVAEGDRLHAFEPATVRRVWTWRAPPGQAFLGAAASEENVAVNVFSDQGPQGETFALDFHAGTPRGRLLGRTLGWHEGRHFVWREKLSEVWIRDSLTGAYLGVRKLDSPEGAVLLHEGEALYASVNRYFTEGVARISADGARELPQEVSAVREMQREGAWRQPWVGGARLDGEILTDVRPDRITAVGARDGALHWELKAASGIRGFAVGPRCVVVLTGDGRVSCYRRT